MIVPPCIGSLLGSFVYDWTFGPGLFSLSSFTRSTGPGRADLSWSLSVRGPLRNSLVRHAVRSQADAPWPGGGLNTEVSFAQSSAEGGFIGSAVGGLDVDGLVEVGQ